MKNKQETVLYQNSNIQDNTARRNISRSVSARCTWKRMVFRTVLTVNTTRQLVARVTEES